MSESQDGSVEHWIMSSMNGYRFMRFRCPICKIWIDGPVFVEEGGVHFIETWPGESHEIVEIVSGWQKRLAGKADIAIDKLHIHVQMVNLDLDPDWTVLGKTGFVQYYLSGEPIDDPKQVYLGEYDAVLIHLFPDGDRTLEQLEELILHELVHAAFPKSSTEGCARFSSVKSEKWTKTKTTQLLKQYGYLFQRSVK